MNNSIHLMTSLQYWSPAGGFGLNTNLLETNLINLTVVIGVLIYFGKGVLSTLLSNRKEAILSTIRDAEERYQEATKQLEEARERLNQAKVKADEIHRNGIDQIERAKKELIQAANEDSKRLEESKNATLRFEEQRAIEKIRQQVSRLAMNRALQMLNNRLNLDSNLHERIIDYHIGWLIESHNYS
uniref:ATP synthase subunit b, chloroplastic n=1 Tax=Spirogyra maxima TaxID=3180 RepID=A0A191T4C9_SPIMX|nr:CF0 subunit I of ATP synthase [Spirogyra maxima]ANI25253.1 CF0 subunit I of ATP synthase [Spirogyra maxima]